MAVAGLLVVGVPIPWLGAVPVFGAAGEERGIAGDG